MVPSNPSAPSDPLQAEVAAVAAVRFGRAIAGWILGQQDAWARIALLVSLGEITFLDELDTADNAIDVAAGVASLAAARSVRWHLTWPASEDE